jgi:peptidoglycan-N-acetylglucosamine deacetylase
MGYSSPVRRSVLSFAVVAPAAAVALWPVSVPLAVSLVVLSHALIVYATLRPASRLLGPVVTRFDTARDEVWLTIDDGPSPDDTESMLDLLDEHGARATFFVVGERVAEQPETIAAIVRRGHAVANHSHTHPSGSFWALGPDRIRREIDDCNAAIESATGSACTLFRAPVGMKNPFVHPILAERGMQLIGWSARGFDGVGRVAPAAVASRIARTISPGAIILLHQGRRAADGTLVSVEVLRRVLERLRSEGYRAVIPTALPSA